MISPILLSLPVKHPTPKIAINHCTGAQKKANRTMLHKMTPEQRCFEMWSTVGVLYI